MTCFRIVLRFLTVLLLLLPVRALAQYIYLDTDGDGENTAADALAPSGTTNLDVWLVTDAGRDGTPVACTQDASAALDFWSYELILKAVGGTVEWGPMQNRLPMTEWYGPAQFAEGDQDTTNATEYHNGWGSRRIFPPGRYLLATLPVRVLSGEPAIMPAPSMSFNGRALTSFGTHCPCVDWDYTRKLGIAGFDASGVGPVVAEAGGPYNGVTTAAVTFSAAASTNPRGVPLQITWDFGDGATGTGEAASHTYASPGTYTVTLTVGDGDRSDTDEAVVRIAPYEQTAPVAVAGGPYAGNTRTSVQFDGGASFDPNGDPLQYVWDFGDGSTTVAIRPMHLYRTGGTYEVKLVVTDGALSGADRTVAVIEAAAQGAPVPDPGGPYTGFVGRGLRFDGSRTTDPDGDPIAYHWDFGDRTWGLGRYAFHTYGYPDVYRVRLTASDEVDNAFATTTASIEAWVPSRAFTTPANAYFDLLGSRSTLEIQIEPVQGIFQASEADLDWIALRSEGTGSTEEILALGTMSYSGDDTDGNGVKEVTAVFHRDDLTRLFDQLTGTSTIPLTLLLPLGGGGRALSHLDLEVRMALPDMAVRVTPNPFNPEGTIRFETARTGRVRVEVFDPQGRLVRVLLDEASSPPRRYTVRIGSELPLASGIYFYRVLTAQGTQSGRFVVAR